MLDKNKIFLVVYVGVKSIPVEDWYENLMEAGRAIGKFDKSVIRLICVNPESDKTTVECINPKLLKDDEYEEVLKKVDEFKKKLDEFGKE